MTTLLFSPAILLLSVLSSRSLSDSFHLQHTQACCCPWFSARPLLHWVRNYTVSDAVMWSPSVNRQSAVVNHCWPGICVTCIKVSIFTFMETPGRFYCTFISCWIDSDLHMWPVCTCLSEYVTDCATHTENTLWITRLSDGPIMNHDPNSVEFRGSQVYCRKEKTLNWL